MGKSLSLAKNPKHTVMPYVKMTLEKIAPQGQEPEPLVSKLPIDSKVIGREN